jgi:hypothetical protein
VVFEREGPQLAAGVLTDQAVLLYRSVISVGSTYTEAWMILFFVTQTNQSDAVETIRTTKVVQPPHSH